MYRPRVEDKLIVDKTYIHHSWNLNSKSDFSSETMNSKLIWAHLEMNELKSCYFMVGHGLWCTDGLDRKLQDRACVT